MSQATSVVTMLNTLNLVTEPDLSYPEKSPTKFWVWEAQNLGCLSGQICRIGTISSLRILRRPTINLGRKSIHSVLPFPLLPSTHPYMKASLNVLVRVTFHLSQCYWCPRVKRSQEKGWQDQTTPHQGLSTGTDWKRHFCIPLVRGEPTSSDFCMFWKCCDIFTLKEHHFFHSFMVLSLLLHFEV